MKNGEVMDLTMLGFMKAGIFSVWLLFCIFWGLRSKVESFTVKDFREVSE